MTFISDEILHDNFVNLARPNHVASGPKTDRMFERIKVLMKFKKPRFWESNCTGAPNNTIHNQILAFYDAESDAPENTILKDRFSMGGQTKAPSLIRGPILYFDRLHYPENAPSKESLNYQKMIFKHNSDESIKNNFLLSAEDKREIFWKSWFSYAIKNTCDWQVDCPACGEFIDHYERETMLQNLARTNPNVRINRANLAPQVTFEELARQGNAPLIRAMGWTADGRGEHGITRFVPPTTENMDSGADSE